MAKKNLNEGKNKPPKQNSQTGKGLQKFSKTKHRKQKIKNSTILQINYWFKPIYESPRGLSICDLFINFSA